MTAVLGGFVQFFIPTHLLAVVALGLLVGQGAGITIAVGAFVLGLAAGSFVVASAIREMPASIALLILASITATLVVIGLKVPSLVGAASALAMGLALPLNAPPHEITIPAAIAAQLGFAVAVLVTFGATMAIAMNATRPWQRIGIRIVCSWIAASAILVLALRLAR